ncbi:hypothetical protein L1887_15973 [Cichorium endivia]|nr:hypothetical protein L1887_15973 [Cichorium endivia]
MNVHQVEATSFPHTVIIYKRQGPFFITVIDLFLRTVLLIAFPITVFCSFILPLVMVELTTMIGSSKIHFVALLLISLASHVKSDASDHRYSDGDTIPIYGNKVGPYSNPLETYDYYNLPFCSQDAVKEKKVVPNNTLSAKPLVPTPYKVEFLVDREFELLCNKRLKKPDGFIGRVERNYRDESIKSKYFLYNHFDFEIFYNKDRVIEIIVQSDPKFVVDITEDKEVDVNFTYSVRWMGTNQSFDERMQRYVISSNPYAVADVTEDKKPFDTIHGYSIANSSFTIFILIICILIFYKRVLQKEICRTVLILILGVTDGFQIYLQGVFLNAFMIVYAITSMISGYKSVSFYCQLEGTNWMKNLLLTGGLYFGPLFLTFSFDNTFAVFYGSTAALLWGETIILSLLWILLALPLLLFGAVIGKNKKPDFKAPCKTTKCPREVPQLRWYKHILPQMLLAGFLSFSVIINIQLHDILSTVWG